MGYYTDFELSVDQDYDKVADYFESLRGDRSSYFSWFNIAHDYWYMTEIKWYEHEEDMRGLSKIFPAVLFTLKGDGERSEDIWIKYFKKGKVQIEKGVITFGEYVESKLC